MRFRNCVAPVAFALLASCASEPPETVQLEAKNEVLANVSAPVAALNLAEVEAPIEPATRKQICKKAIAELNGHSTSIMKIVSDADGIVGVRYARPDDGKVWTNECKFDGNRVIWRTVDAFGSGSGTGRWRDGPYDEKITYELRAGRPSVHIEY
jgi:hypothetical protein